MTEENKVLLQKNEALSRQCDLFQAMFNATNDQIYLYDSEIKFLYVNSPGAKALGLELPQVLGKTWRETGLSVEVMKPLEAYIRKVFKTGWPVREETRLSLNGEAGFFEHILTPIRDQAGKVCSVLATVRDNTERRITEEELNYQRTLLQTVFESTPEYLYILDQELNYLFVSPTIPKVLDLESDEMIGMAWEDITFPSTVMEPFVARIKEVFETGKTVYAESQFQVAGELRYYENVLTPVTTESEQVEFMLVSARDITKRKWYELALKESTFIAEKRAGELNRIFASISDGLIIYDQHGNIIRMNEVAREVFGYIMVDYKTLRGEHGVQVNICLPDGTPFKPEEDPAYKAVHGEVVRNVEVQIIKNPGTPKWLIVSAAPLKDVTNEISGAVLTFKDITERKQTEEVLRETRDYLDNLFNYANTPIIVWDQLFRITRFNHAFEYLTGRKAEEVLGQEIDILFPEESCKESLVHIRQTTCEGEHWEGIEIPILHRNGNVRIVFWNSAQVLAADNRTVVATIAQGQDITERKRAEEELRTSENRFKTLFTTINEGFYLSEILYDENGQPSDYKYLEVNPAFEQFMGLSREQIIGKRYKEQVPNYAQQWMEVFSKVAVTGIPAHYNFYSEAFKKYFETYAFKPVEGQIAVVVNDISERKLMEATLRESEEKYRTLVENNSFGILLTQPDGTILAANNAACGIFGMSQEELRHVGRSGIVDTSDPRLAVALKQRKLFGKNDLHELTLIRKGGIKFTGEVSSVIFKNKHGQPFVSMILSDISERKWAEEKMTFQAKLLSNISDVVYATDAELRLIHWNHAAEKMYGWTAEEVLGKNVLDVVKSKIAPEQRAKFTRDLLEKGSVIIELEHQNKIGTTIVFESSTLVIRDIRGKATGYVSFNHDITERKKADEKLRESEEKYRSLFNSIGDGFGLYEVIYDDDGKPYDYRFLEINPAYERGVGSSRDQIIGRSMREIHPNIEHNWLEFFSKVAETGEPGHYIDYSSFTGRWINIYAYTARKGQIAFLLRDITERKRTEEALLQSQQKLAEILENIDGGFVTYDTEWRFTNINTRAAQNVGYEPSDLIGKIIWEVFPKTIGTPMEAFFRKAMTERVPVHFEEHGTLTERWYLYDIYPTREGIVNIWYDITERKQTEEALREKQEEQTSLNEELQAQQEELYINYQELQSKSEKIREYADAATQVGQEAEQRAAELDATISSIAIGVVIFDFSGNIIRKNEYAQKLFLLSREDHNLGYHERREILKLHKPDGASYKSEESLLYRALQGEVILNEEVMIGVPEKPVWLSSTFKPIYSNKGNLTGVILTFNDITEQKRKVESLLASERELLRVTLDSLNEAVVAADTAERIIFINQAAAKLTGYSQEEVIGEPISKILYLLDDYTSEPLNHLTAQETPYQPVLVTRDLQEVVISMNSAPIKTTDGQIVGTVIILQDITDKQKTEQELLKAAKLDSLGILAGGVAHDFNNILAGILANLQLAALKQKKREDISKYLENTIEISRKASNLTKQLLTFAKGGDPVKKATAIVKLVKETVQFALSGSKVKAQYQLPEDLWVVDIDEGQISQVINNLAINADQAMPIGGILEIHGENVILETAGQHNPGQYVRLKVKDHGIGIPTEIINKIFDPFFTTKRTGNGLGLSTSYSIIKKHNGYLEVESVPGIGTTFNILLPASMGELTVKETQKELAASGEAKILLMDDEDAIREVGGEMLACFGYRVTLARDGQEAIELYKNAKETGEPFDVVIMDLTVPGGLGGVETMAILRQINPEIKAIISSGYASDPVMSDYEKYGFSGVVSKPYKFDELNEVLNKVIDKKQLPLELKY